MRSFLFVLMLSCAGLATEMLADVTASEKKFDAYVNLHRDFSGLTDIKKVIKNGYSLYRFGLTSQSWKKHSVKPGVWTHWLLIRVPEKVRYPEILLYVSNGRFGEALPSGQHRFPAEMSRKAGIVSAELRMVPGQPLMFEDGKQRSEDAVIAWSWKKFFDTSDPEWIAQGPMIIAVREAMDYLEQNDTNWPGVKKGGFILSGQSKRAWTSWLTCLRDKRVRALMPLVFDLLNLEKNMKHHHSVLGFWAPALNDYVQHGIPPYLGSEKFSELAKIVDPYARLSELILPKYIINAANDEFFLPDSSQFYFRDLPGDKGLRYVPNSGHGIDDSGDEFVSNAVAALTRILEKKPLDLLKWKRVDNNLHVTSLENPTRISWWEAESPVRDFRNGENTPVYKRSILQPGNSRDFNLALSVPDKGWIAGFLEVCYGGGEFPYCVTTDVFVTGSRPKQK